VAPAIGTGAIENGFLAADDKTNRSRYLNIRNGCLQIINPVTAATDKMRMMAILYPFIAKGLSRIINTDNEPLIGHVLQLAVYRPQADLWDYASGALKNFRRG